MTSGRHKCHHSGKKVTLAALATLALVILPTTSASAAISSLGPGCATNSICVTTAGGSVYGFQGTGTRTVKIANVAKYCAQYAPGGPVTSFSFGGITHHVANGTCSTTMKGETLTKITR